MDTKPTEEEMKRARLLACEVAGICRICFEAGRIDAEDGLYRTREDLRAALDGCEECRGPDRDRVDRYRAGVAAIAQSLHTYAAERVMAADDACLRFVDSIAESRGDLDPVGLMKNARLLLGMPPYEPAHAAPQEKAREPGGSLAAAIAADLKAGTFVGRSKP